jgi:hypothetical protein
MLILITSRSESEYAFFTAGDFVCDQSFFFTDVPIELSLILRKLCMHFTKGITP